MDSRQVSGGVPTLVVWILDVLRVCWRRAQVLDTLLSDDRDAPMDVVPQISWGSVVLSTMYRGCVQTC
jgi:hypothetical protein